MDVQVGVGRLARELAHALDQLFLQLIRQVRLRVEEDDTAPRDCVVSPG